MLQRTVWKNETSQRTKAKSLENIPTIKGKTEGIGVVCRREDLEETSPEILENLLQRRTVGKILHLAKDKSMKKWS